jgi:hypothetical protein
MSVGQGQL